MRSITEKYLGMMSNISMDVGRSVIATREAQRLLQEFEIELLTEWEKDCNDKLNWELSQMDKSSV